MGTNVPIVEVVHVSKRFCRQLRRALWYGVKDLYVEFTGGSHQTRNRLRPGEFYAVRDASFQVRQGECVAMIGPNGAGKSTMMRMLSGLLKPNAGHIAIDGRVAALMELGAGFNPQLSGKENIFVSGAMLGMSRREIVERFDEIVEFSELGEVIHAPFKTYSSGMRMRLGYSVATHLRPQLLLLDEVLAVGDVGFRMKCFSHLAKLRDAGVSIIIVSHAIGALSRIAERALVFGNSQVQFDGDLERGVAVYQDLVGLENQKREGPSRRNEQSETSIAHIESVRTLDDEGQERTDFETGESVVVEIELAARQRLSEARIVMQLESPVLGPLTAISSAAQGFKIDVPPEGTKVRFTLPDICLLVGSYQFNVVLYGATNVDYQDRRLACGRFKIVGPPLGEPGYGVRGYLKLPHRWD